MQTTEFTVDLDQEGLGTLLITDIELMLRPADPGQLYKDSPYSTSRMWAVMALGDDDSDGCGNNWYVSTRWTAREAASRLDRAWYAYFNGYCMGNRWIDVRVVYIGANGETVRVKEYGFEDGHASGSVSVYCREYWESLHPSGDPAQADWAKVLSAVTMCDDVTGPVPFDQIEHALAHQTFPDAWTSRVVVVRPSDSELGYTARGFELMQP